MSVLPDPNLWKIRHLRGDMNSLPKLTTAVLAVIATGYWLTTSSLLGFQEPARKGQGVVLPPDNAPTQRPADAPFRILFVGYVRREKGVDTLLEACERLLGQVSRSLELSVVGARERDDRGAAGELLAKLDALGTRMPVRFEGHQAFGEPLQYPSSRLTTEANRDWQCNRPGFGRFY
jgi:glycosyltransferase involved in cell wall biosynthesis